jgi:acetyl esterase/lipase
MRLIRSRAAEYRIDPARLGVLGFSAGGHLAADLAVSHAEQTYRAIDAADSLSARPAFVGLVYAVISLDPAISKGNSARNLLGPTPAKALVDARLPASRVNAGTPPSFVAAAFDDGLIHIDNSLLWIEACRGAGASVEAHLFATGGHGFGLHLPKDNPGSLWPDLFALWMRRHGA